MKKRIRFITVVLICMSIFLNSVVFAEEQLDLSKIKDLEAKLKSEQMDESSKIKAYSTLAFYYSGISDYDKAETYAKEITAMDINTMSDKLIWAQGSQLITNIYMTRGEHAKSLENALRNEKIFDSLGKGFRDYIIDNLVTITYLYIQTGNSLLANDYLQKLQSLTNADKMFDDAEVNKVYNEYYDLIIDSIKAMSEKKVTVGFLEAQVSKVANKEEYDALIKKLDTFSDNLSKLSVDNQNTILSLGLYQIMDMYLAGDNNDKAIGFIERFSQAIEKDAYTDYDAYYYAALAFYKKKDVDAAIEQLDYALEVSEETKNKSQKVGALALRTLCLYELEEYGEAEKDITEAIELNKQIKNNVTFMDLYELDYKVYSAQKRYKEAAGAMEKYIYYKDIVVNESVLNEIASKEIIHQRELNNAKLEAQNAKLESQNVKLEAQKRIIIISVGAAIILAIFLAFVIRLYLLNKKLRKKVEIEKNKTEKLLLNILPSKVASELKVNGYTEPENFRNVSVYFSDIVNFTNTSSSLEPKVLINELNELFTKFDEIFEKYKCERIKTIGDAYLGVCGMPVANKNHAENIIDASLEILSYLSARNESSEIKWQIRIGVHSGSIVGGVVGIKKYIYDVFGDTVNTASRMESNSEPMRINVSQSTYKLVKDKYVWEERGEVVIKGKGRMTMYFVKGKIDNQ